MSKEYYIAELKYTDGQRVEMGETPSYVVVKKVNEDLGDGVIYTRFINLFTFEEYPTFSRSRSVGLYRYGERDDMTGDGSMYGCSLIQESSDMKDGPCYILTGEKMNNLPIEDIENMVIHSKRYFKDRARLIRRRRGVNDFASWKIIREDTKKYNSLVDYFNSRDCNDFNIKTGRKKIRS